MRLVAIGAVVCTLAFGASGCSTSPSDQPFAGTWTGTITNNLVSPGTARLTQIQSGNHLTGTWSVTYADPANDNSGTISGTVSGNGGTATLTPSNPTSCPIAATFQISGSQQTGTYATFNCTVSSSGAFNLTKQ